MVLFGPSQEQWHYDPYERMTHSIPWFPTYGPGYGAQAPSPAPPAPRVEWAGVSPVAQAVASLLTKCCSALTQSHSPTTPHRLGSAGQGAGLRSHGHRPCGPSIGGQHPASCLPGLSLALSMTLSPPVPPAKLSLWPFSGPLSPCLALCLSLSTSASGFSPTILPRLSSLLLCLCCLWLSGSFPTSICLSLSLCLCLSLISVSLTSVSFYLSLSVPLFLLCLSLFLSPHLFLSLPLFSVPVSVSLSLSLYLCFCVSISVSVCLYLSLYLSP